MSDHENALKLIKGNEVPVTNLQRSLLSSIGLLVHMTFLKTMKPTTNPVNKVIIPEISSLSRILNKDSDFIHLLCNLFVDEMNKRSLFLKYFKEEDLFNPENTEALKSLINMIIIFESKRLPDIICDKFLIRKGLGVFQEKIGYGWSKDIFNENHVAFVVDHTILHMISNKLIPSVTDVDSIFIVDTTRMACICNNAAIDNLYLNTSILSNNDMMDTISFVNKLTFESNESHYIVNIEDPNSRVSLYEI